MTDLLTTDEREVIELAGELWNRICGVVGTARNRDRDLAELVPHIHAIQQAVMSNAAARAYPGEFRLLGEADFFQAET